MEEREDIQKELAALSPLLAALKKEEQLEIPTTYFDELPDTVWHKTQTGTTPKPTTIGAAVRHWLNSVFEPRGVLVLTAIGLLLVASYWLLPKQETAPVALLEELSPEEINVYISENIDAFEEELLEIFPTDIELSFDEFDGLNKLEIEELKDAILDDLDATTLDEFL